MSDILLTTKLYIPALREQIVARPRLFERLEAGLGGRLTLLSAPAGFGKTTLLSAWLRQGERLAAWISLDESDNDPVRFQAYLGMALDAIQGHIERLAAHGEEPEMAKATSAPAEGMERSMAALINRAAGFCEPFLVVLDDYGFGNTVLNHLGLEARFAGSQLLDPLFNYKNENLPKITDFAPGPATSGVESIVFNHATSLDNIPQSQVIAWSSPFSFLDENQNGYWDGEETKGSFPVVAEFDMGKGDFILLET